MNLTASDTICLLPLFFFIGINSIDIADSLDDEEDVSEPASQKKADSDDDDDDDAPDDDSLLSYVSDFDESSIMTSDNEEIIKKLVAKREELKHMYRVAVNSGPGGHTKDAKFIGQQINELNRSMKEMLADMYKAFGDDEGKDMDVDKSTGKRNPFAAFGGRN